MKTLLFSCGLVLLSVFHANAQKSPVYISSGSAVGGYDVVAYFTQGKPVKGDPKLSYNWHGADWHFSNDANLKLFEANPTMYAPQFGGYCAYGVSQGHKAPVDGQAWTIVGNKLYLNYSSDVKKKWLVDTSGLIKVANKNWPEIRDKE
jgi:YHS domain-containing protein